MKKQSNRRKFLATSTSRAGVAAAAIALVDTAKAAPEKEKTKGGKKVFARPGQQVAPGALYSPGVQLGNLIFTSGHIPMDPATREIVPGPFANQVRQCLENVKEVVEAGGSSMGKVLKCTVFLSDIANYQAMNEVYVKFFPSDPPARTTIAVKDLPFESPIEIECIAGV